MLNQQSNDSKISLGYNNMKCFYHSIYVRRHKNFIYQITNENGAIIRGKVVDREAIRYFEQLLPLSQPPYDSPILSLRGKFSFRPRISQPKQMELTPQNDLLILLLINMFSQSFIFFQLFLVFIVQLEMMLDLGECFYQLELKDLLSRVYIWPLTVEHHVEW